MTTKVLIPFGAMLALLTLVVVHSTGCSSCGGDDKKAIEAYKKGTTAWDQGRQGPYKEFEALLEQYNQLLGADPQDPEALKAAEDAALAKLNEAEQHFQTGVQHFTEAISHKQDFGEAYMGLGFCYFMVQDYGKSAGCLGKAKELFDAGEFVDDVEIPEDKKKELAEGYLAAATTMAEDQGQEVFLPPIAKAAEGAGGAPKPAQGAQGGRGGGVADRMKQRVGQRAKMQAQMKARGAVARSVPGGRMLAPMMSGF